MRIDDPQRRHGFSTAKGDYPSKEGTEREPKVSVSWETFGPNQWHGPETMPQRGGILLRAAQRKYRTERGRTGLRKKIEMSGELLYCPIRGTLTVPAKAADNLTFTEENRRIDCIKFLLEKGYPPTHFKIETVLLRFGHKGRNSFRTDIAVLDAPVSTLPHDIDKLKPHIKLIAEIKRDNKDAEIAKQTQVYPAMDFLRDISAYGIYWDDTQQRLFYKLLYGTKWKVNETSVALLPHWGHAWGSRKLRKKDLRTTNLLKLFEQIEDDLHALMQNEESRFQAMLQMLLIKLYDEHTHPNCEHEMSLHDYADAPMSDKDIVGAFEQILVKSIKFYGKYLPKEVPEKIRVDGSSLRSISSRLTSIRIFGSKRDVIQDFYMYFAKGVYRWDMPQYFTPTEVVDFIVKLTNPQADDQVKDPACGSTDFLISALHHVKDQGGDIRDAVWGSDNNEDAVQISVLNMVINGDGKSNIKHEDSLVTVDKYLGSYNIVLCNPP